MLQESQRNDLPPSFLSPGSVTMTHLKPFPMKHALWLLQLTRNNKTYLLVLVIHFQPKGMYSRRKIKSCYWFLTLSQIFIRPFAPQHCSSHQRPLLDLQNHSRRVQQAFTAAGKTSHLRGDLGDLLTWLNLGSRLKALNMARAWDVCTLRTLQMAGEITWQHWGNAAGKLSQRLAREQLLPLRSCHFTSITPNCIFMPALLCFSADLLLKFYCAVSFHNAHLKCISPEFITRRHLPLDPAYHFAAIYVGKKTKSNWKDHWPFEKETSSWTSWVRTS